MAVPRIGNPPPPRIVHDPSGDDPQRVPGTMREDGEGESGRLSQVGVGKRVLSARTPEELTRAAWTGLDEFTRTGQITLPAGGGQDGESPRVISPNKEDPTCRVMVDVFKWLAQLQGKPRKTPKAMDDWHPKETRE